MKVKLRNCGDDCRVAASRNGSSLARTQGERSRHKPDNRDHQTGWHPTTSEAYRHVQGAELRPSKKPCWTSSDN